MKPCIYGKVPAKSVAAMLALSAFLFPALVFGQWNRGDLNSAVTSAAAGGTVTVPVQGVNFDNAYTSASAVAINKNLTLSGSAPNGFPTSIGNLTTDILNQIRGQKTDSVTSLIPLVSSRVDTFGVPGMSFIQGSGGGSRGRSTDNLAEFNVTKWLDITAGSHELSLQFLHFRDVSIENTFTSTSAGGVVNGLIGSISSNTGDTTMGNMRGNAFTGIGVTLHGYEDTHYLAGGGVIGLRATGEGGAPSASASMGDIIGNVFKDVTVITDGTNSYNSESAYIEGGGVIGVDGVSTPDTKSGHASIRSLDNNLFTDIEVRSDDIILGGGVVGVNNNSQNSDLSTYSEILAVSGNIFGNGILDTTTPENSGIYVTSKYSLRGGGVIGVNGLSNAAVWLNGLTNNVFAGIYVDTDSYLKGGGIIG
ncbi:MAG: hypothetical protein LBF51_05020, partial [Zoogloeaceae bacterium]|nr:hypothetical protein [Zoogloeaceae bacterium]